MKNKNKYAGWRYLPLLFLGLWGMGGCSGHEGAFAVVEGRELQLRSFSEKLSGEAAFSSSVFFAKGGEPGTYTEIWQASVQADGKTSLATPHYYPSDDSRIYLRGFAPEGKPAGDGQIAWSINGRQDLLVTDEQSGSLTDMFWQEGKSFHFTHLLTQLRFRLRCDAAGKEQGWKLLSLTAEGTQRDVVLSLANKSLLFRGEQGVIKVLDRSAGEELLPLETDWRELAERVMIQPGAAVSLTVVVEDRQGQLTRFERLPVAFYEEGNLSASGTSYLLSVTLRTEEAVFLTVAVAPWKTGASGGGEINND